MMMLRRGRPKNFWTQEREQKLRDMNARGCTDGEIAKAFGCSRNKIIGKRSRLGLSAKPKVVKALPPKEPKPIGPLNDIPANGCRWIHGAPCEGDWRMCGHPTSDDSSYCEHHRLRTTAPAYGALRVSEEAA